MSDNPAAALSNIPLSHVMATDALTDAYLSLRKLQDSAEAGMLYPSASYLSETYYARANGRLEQQIEHCREILWQLTNALSACQVPGFVGLPERLSGQDREQRAEEKARLLASEHSQDGNHG